MTLNHSFYVKPIIILPPMLYLRLLWVDLIQPEIDFPIL